MLIVLTSSKTMDTSSQPSFQTTTTTPLFLPQTKQLWQRLAAMTPAQLQRAMKLSERLAVQVARLYDEPSDPVLALWAYRGDVYRGLRADSITEPAAQWAQHHLVIASGLYGLVRPFDSIWRYRLEMKTQLGADAEVNLYKFWADQLGRYVEQHANGTVVMLVSDEYRRAVVPGLGPNTTVIDVVFQDKSSTGQYKTVPIYSKVMRGAMARWLIDVRCDEANRLKEFSEHGYRYDHTASGPTQLVFRRDIPAPIRP